MDTIYFFYALNYLLMIGLPFILARMIRAKRQAGWGLFGVGALAFVLSQVGHIPFNWLILQRLAWVPSDNVMAVAIFAGLSAGVFEEGARYLAYRYFAPDARTWGKGLMLGAGHGGIEAILLGVLGAWTVVQLALLRNGYLLDQVPADRMAAVQAQITAVFTAPWYDALLGAVERLSALCIQVSLSILVLQQFVHGQRKWLIIAILWHAFVDALSVYAIANWGVYVTEVLVAGTAVISLGIIFWLKTPEPAEIEPEPLPPVGTAVPLDLEITADHIDSSRYTN
ncbi:MAG: YhfC family intramembrane metalloprotease [Ardenticatenaceae bacterium]|nr:YhfC family intramembrane metalloprotease [Ardenticatenaceae bacterium]MCB9444809.1 YhfC family intramembrane metalloprotease [Ardenticatenaceae bacterium]